MAQIELQVSGMHCSSCVALIEEALLEQPGVRSVLVALEAERAVVSYDPSQLTVDQIRAVIADTGYATG